MTDLKQLLKFDNSLPYLFIGSGFSRRYLDTPDWIGLLSHFCKMIHPDNDLAFQAIQEQAMQQVRSNTSKSVSSVNDINCAIADILEREFNIAWYTSPLFADSREHNKNIVSTEVTPFKIELAAYFKSALQKPFLLPEELKKLEAITNNNIAGIITTNYDCLIEKYFNFTRYVSQEKLLFSTTQELCEIYKIHGCATEPGSIIINSDDYSEIAKKRKYLAAKLLTIFVEHPIIFIGYSITDEDIVNILSDIVDCLNPEQLEVLRSRLIFIERLFDSSPSEYEIERTSMVFGSKSIPMTKILLKDYGLLYDILSQNRSKYPVRILRELKQHIYELIVSNDPTDKLKIMLPLEQTGNFKDADFVIGVGAIKATELAYSTFSAEDIFLDIVFDDKDFDYDLLVENTLPVHLSRTSGSMPIFKYLSKYTKDTFPPVYDHYIKKLNTIDALFNNSILKNRSTQFGKSISEIDSRCEFSKKMYYILRLPPSYINRQELGDFLKRTLLTHTEEIKTGHAQSSAIRKLIKIYDWLLYYDDFKKKQASMQPVSLPE